ncbi:MAG: sensor histidine kinase [Pseudomonadota bacterium]
MASAPQTLRTSPWLPTRGPFARWPRASDACLALFVFFWNVVIFDDGPDDELAFRSVAELPIAMVVVIALTSGALYWRRRYPMAVLAVNVGAISLMTAVSYIDSVWAVPFALYAAGRYTADSRWSYVGIVVALVAVMLNVLMEGEPVSVLPFAVVFLFLIWYLGRYNRVRGEYLRLLEERAAQLERERERETRRALAEERTRIARELHDVVAHRVSLMTVQAGAAKTVFTNDPQSSLQAMGAVEDAGREALSELRHLLGVLRPEAESNDLGPQPGLDDIPRLVEQSRDAGYTVSLEIDDASMAVPDRVALSAYRIVQESLTNVLKHAGPGAETAVKLRRAGDEIIVEVKDNGRGAAMLPGSGNGIVGMRERAQLLGGSLAANARPDGGFEVIARLPIREGSQ